MSQDFSYDAKMRTWSMLLAILAEDGPINRDVRVHAEVERIYQDGIEAVGPVIGYLAYCVTVSLERAFGTDGAIERLMSELVELAVGENRQPPLNSP